MALVVKSLHANSGDTRDPGSISGSGRSPGGGKGNPLQYSYQENPMDRGGWLATVHGLAKSQRQLSTHCTMEISPGVEEMTKRKTDSQPIDRYSQHSFFC